MGTHMLSSFVGTHMLSSFVGTHWYQLNLFKLVPISRTLLGHYLLFGLCLFKLILRNQKLFKEPFFILIMKVLNPNRLNERNAWAVGTSSF